MILVDTNLLVYAYSPESSSHEASRAWLEEIASREHSIRVAWTTVLGFLRIMTSARIVARPLKAAAALAVVRQWFDEGISLLDPGERHFEVFEDMVLAGQGTGNLMMDAHLAALAVEHGAVLYTNDRDFSRFPRLDVRYPLQKP